MKEEGDAHEHVCSGCLKKYRCTDPDDADLEMGTCPECKAKTSKPKKARQKKGTKR